MGPRALVIKMDSLRPYIYWFGYEEGKDENLEVHFFQTIVLSPSRKEAFSWGEIFSTDFVRKDVTRKIHSAWVEDVIPDLIVSTGSKPIDWNNISCRKIETYFQGTASKSSNLEDNINGFISTSKEQDAKKIWETFLASNYPEHTFRTCSKTPIAIARIGIYPDF